jgi:Flp pilus assembly secretin CpaC
MAERVWPVRRITKALGVVAAIILGIVFWCPAPAGAAQELHLTKGQYFTLHLQAPVKRVTVADPSVVSPKVISPRTVRLLSLQYGLTNVLVDYEGGGTDNFTVMVSVDVGELRSQLRRFLPDEPDIRVQSNMGTIILEGEVSNRYAMETAIDIARPFANAHKTIVHRIREDIDRPEKLTVESEAPTPFSTTGSVSSGEGGGGGGTAGASASLEPGQSIPKADAVPDLLNLMTIAETPQVLLEVKVAEVARAIIKELGINFAAFDRNANTALVTFVGGIVQPGASALPVGGRGAINRTDTVVGNPEAIFQTSQSDLSLDAVIDLLKQNGLVRLLAEPNLITMSGQEASFLAGGEFPIPVVQNVGGGGQTGGSITVEYKEFGVRVNFVPTVIGNNKVISLAVRPEVSQLDYANAVVISGFRIPALNTRRADTTIQLRSGETYAIAGLLDHRLNETVNKIPGFADIPVIGPLFRSSEFNKNESELLILVTPRLIRPLKAEEVPKLPTADYIEPTDYDFYLWGRLEGRPPGDDTALATLGEPKQGGLVGAWGHYH